MWPRRRYNLDSSVIPNPHSSKHSGTSVDRQGISEKERKEALRRLSNTLQSSENDKVILVGDVMLDRYHHGFANNLNSTAPVPVLKIFRTEENAGAAAHIAQSLSSLGISVSLHAVVGSDREGIAITNSLEDLGVETSGLEAIEDHSTLVKTRFFASRESLLDRPQIILQADREDSEGIPESVSDRICNRALDAMSGSIALVISDYDKGVITRESARQLIEEANRLNIPVIMDPKLTGLDRSGNSSIVIFERRGLDLLRRRMGLDDAYSTTKSLMEEYRWGAVLILGGNVGVTLFHSDGRQVFSPTSIMNPRQQIGLHDAAASALSFALGNGHDLIDASILAGAACDCILASPHGESVLTREALTLRVDEILWQMKLSDR